MKKLFNFDVFNLGFSFLAYYLVIFSILPVAFCLGLTTEFTNLPARGINLLTIEAFAYLLVGLIAFIVGYYPIAKRFTHGSLAEFLNKPWDSSRSLWVMVVVLAAGFAIKCPRIISNLTEPNADVETILLSFLSLNPLHFIALAIAFSQYFFLLRNLGERTSFWRLIAWSLFVFEFLGQVKFGAGRMSILTPVLIYLITRHYLYRRCAGRIILIGLGIFLLVFPIKLYMKDKANLDQNYFIGQQGQSSINILPSDLSRTATLVVDSSLGRLGQSHIFTAVVERTEDLLYGKGFLDFFRAFDIQSLIHRNNFFINDGNDFGKAIGILRTHDVVTGVGPTQVGDMYLNFGPSGVVIGMLLLGILYRYLFENFVAAGSLSGMMFYSILWIQVIHGFEDWLSLSYVRHIKILFALLVVHIILTTNLKMSGNYQSIWSGLTARAKALWSMGTRSVCISFISLVFVSTTLANSITFIEYGSNGDLETLATAGVYQKLMRDLEKCERMDIPSFRESLPRDRFFHSIMREQEIRPRTHNSYLLGLVEFAKGHDKEAQAWFLSAARKGHLVAIYNLGMMYEQGYGVTKDHRTAIKWYSKAEKQNFVPAIRSLGKLYLNSVGTQNQLDQAFQFFSRAASQGDASAQTSLGYMYQTGTFTSRDLTEALELFEKAVGKGNSSAMVQLAQLYESGIDVPLDVNKALELYHRAAHLDNPKAMRRLSELYQFGAVVPKDEDLARSWKIMATRAEENGRRPELMEQYYSALRNWAQSKLNVQDSTAMRTMGILYAEGLAIPKDLTQALKWFIKAGRRGDVPSMRNLGVMYERGLGVKIDTAKARKWDKAAASEGDPIASKNIGQLYERERMRVPNNPQAYNWYRKAVHAGNNIAMCKLGKMYYRGENVARAFDVAAQWFKRSADKGNAAAMNNIGLQYELGRGVEVSYGKAFQWYEQSAQNGSFAGMRNLGLMYERGLGIDRNYDQAIQWYQKASQGLDSIARTKLSKL